MPLTLEYFAQRHIQNAAKHLRWRVLRKQLTVTIFAKPSTLGVWQHSESAIVQYFPVRSTILARTEVARSWINSDI